MKKKLKKLNICKMFALYFMQEITGKLSNARRGIRLIELGPGSGSLTNSILHVSFLNGAIF